MGLYIMYAIIVFLLMPLLTPKGNTVYRLLYLLISLGLPPIGPYIWWWMGRH